MQTRFRDFKDKQFVVRGPVEQNICEPLANIDLAYCYGTPEIVQASDANLNGGNKGNKLNENKPNENKPNESKPDENKPAIPSIDNLSPEQLKSLLKDILGKL